MLPRSDVAAGLVLAAAGFAIFTRKRRHPIGVLLLAASGAWFLGYLSPALVFLHRGPLIHIPVLSDRPTTSVDGACCRCGWLHVGRRGGVDVGAHGHRDLRLSCCSLRRKRLSERDGPGPQGASACTWCGADLRFNPCLERVESGA